MYLDDDTENTTNWDAVEAFLQQPAIKQRGRLAAMPVAERGAFEAHLRDYASRLAAGRAAAEAANAIQPATAAHICFNSNEELRFDRFVAPYLQPHVKQVWLAQYHKRSDSPVAAPEARRSAEPVPVQGEAPEAELARLKAILAAQLAPPGSAADLNARCARIRLGDPNPAHDDLRGNPVLGSERPRR